MEYIYSDKWITFVGTILTVLVSLAIWTLTQRANRMAQERMRREERYQALLDSLRGFYVSSYDQSLRSEFLRQLNLAWMYCPDAVIKVAYEFLETVRDQKKVKDEEKELALGRLVLAIRKDMASGKILKKTNLSPEDFKHLQAT
ncbi:MAG: hypothetical protein ACJ763_13920 [Bdellovibrionia bacterium]